jgi:REP element-mobilizing transposase RayT
MREWQIVGIIKENRSREIKKEFPILKEVYCGREGIWSAGYFVSRIGIKEEEIKRYIEYEGKNDAWQGVHNLQHSLYLLRYPHRQAGEIYQMF